MGTEHYAGLNPVDNSSPSSANEVHAKSKKGMEPKERGDVLPRDRVEISEKPSKAHLLLSLKSTPNEDVNKYLKMLKIAAEVEEAEKKSNSDLAPSKNSDDKDIPRAV
jgi:hypothetical protein